MKIYNKDGTIIGEIYDGMLQPDTPEDKPEGKKIAICIGHQINNQGAYGSEGIGEWQFNSDLVDEFLPALKARGHNTFEVFMRDPNISGYGNQMKELHSRIDSWGAEISVELHFNAASNEDINGHEVLYCSEKGKTVAKELNDLFSHYLKSKDRGIKKVSMEDRGGGFCCRGHSVAIISEPFFGAHQHRFLPGGDLRENLKRAYIEFFDGL